MLPNVEFKFEFIIISILFSKSFIPLILDKRLVDEYSDVEVEVEVAASEDVEDVTRLPLFDTPT